MSMEYSVRTLAKSESWTVAMSQPWHVCIYLDDDKSERTSPLFDPNHNTNTQPEKEGEKGQHRAIGGGVWGMEPATVPGKGIAGQSTCRITGSKCCPSSEVILKGRTGHRRRYVH